MLALIALQFLAAGAFTADATGESPPAAVSLESYTPATPVPGLRQVTARFTGPMVGFGDSAGEDPFQVECPVPGSGRWLDARTWLYDFERPLPGGLVCRFSPRAGLSALDGRPLEEVAAFEVGTGGPGVAAVLPPEYGPAIDENQVFILRPDGAVRVESVAAHSVCEAEGIAEQIPVRLITGAEREELLGQRRALGPDYLRLLEPDGSLTALPPPSRRSAMEDALLLLQCQRPLPAGRAVRLVWGAGIVSPTGVATQTPQVLSYRTRPAFVASLHCQRVNAAADCLPMRPLSLRFSTPVARQLAGQVRLSGPGDERRPPSSLQPAGPWVSEVLFDGPFPERSRLQLRLPPDLVDDAGRPLANRARFPLSVDIDPMPPLLRLPAEFGVLEGATPVLPVTVRDVGEAAGEALPARLPGRYLRLQPASATDADVLAWMQRVRAARRPRQVEVPGGEGEPPRRLNVTGVESVFTAAEALEDFALPRPEGSRPLEVLGIELPGAGFHVVELASPRLGAALLGRSETMHVQSAALVTDLAVHLKLGLENAVGWVTRLSTGEPVPDARLRLSDCEGRLLWQGESDAQGLAFIPGESLPEPLTLPFCDELGNVLMLSARQGGDLGLVLSSWDEGIAPWAFNLPTTPWSGPFVAHTVLGRTLLRAGETVHMKHYLRRQSGSGLALPAAADEPDTLVITHAGSGQRFELPLRFEQGMAVSQWASPPEAPLGLYELALRGSARELFAGRFRLAEFQVPTMRASLQFAGAELVAPEVAELDIQLGYLDGGAAAGAPVSLRTQTEPRLVRFDAHPDYAFGGPPVQEGLESGPSWLQSHQPEPGNGVPDQARTVPLVLDEGGAARAAVPLSGTPSGARSLVAELEYQDANGETLTVAARAPLWPSAVVLGFRAEGWLESRERIAIDVLAVDVRGRPLAGQEVVVDLFAREHYAYRKRLLGGFYAYEQSTATRALGEVCRGLTDERGHLRCSVAPPASGQLVARARSRDADGRTAEASYFFWVPGAGDNWFQVEDSDRMDLLPERERYEPGEQARLQVRMPFRQAQALVTVEREGILDAHVTTLTAASPVVEVPVKAGYAPDVFVSVLAVRGRAEGPAPTARVDLAKPAFRLGYARLEVGRRAHRLEVSVSTPGEAFDTREQVNVRVRVRRADGGPLPPDASVAFAAVDAGLLELAPNASWDLLEAMMAPRGLGVSTATAQMQVVGKRHYGRKAAAPGGGGGGGREGARRLFDTLLSWQPEISLDARGEAVVPLRLGDALTTWKLVAVASAGADAFGTGSATLRTTQPLGLFSGLPPVLRDGDRFQALFTVRNGTGESLSVSLEPRGEAEFADAAAEALTLAPRHLELAPGEGREVAWSAEAPAGARALHWSLQARARMADGRALGDSLAISQQVRPRVPVRTRQATLLRLDTEAVLPVRQPDGALPGRGGLSVRLSPDISGGLAGVRQYMAGYELVCLEQQISVAIALGERARWDALVDRLPVYQRGSGLLGFFPARSGESDNGSALLTAYVLAVADQAGWPLPEPVKSTLLGALGAFARGAADRPADWRTPDLGLRRLAAIEALSRYGMAEASWLDSLDITPARWPTAALIDWIGILRRLQGGAADSAALTGALSMLRARLVPSGSMLQLGSGPWPGSLSAMLGSDDLDAVRLLLAVDGLPGWDEELPRLALGALARQQSGHWDTTLANAWGMLAFQALGPELDGPPPTGRTELTLPPLREQQDWARQPEGGRYTLAWPRDPESLVLQQLGQGRPWALVESRAAVPVAEPVSRGLSVKRSITPVTQARPGQWSRGDVVRVSLAFELPQPLNWVAISDPVPAGATLLGRALQRDSGLLAAGTADADPPPLYEQRGQHEFQAYYRHLPAGTGSLSYTLRLNTPGHFGLPATRMEAMYAPGLYAEFPNPPLQVEPR